MSSDQHEKTGKGSTSYPYPPFYRDDVQVALTAPEHSSIKALEVSSDNVIVPMLPSFRTINKINPTPALIRRPYLPAYSRSMATPTITPENLTSAQSGRDGYFHVEVDTSDEIPEYTKDPKALPRRLVEPPLTTLAPTPAITETSLLADTSDQVTLDSLDTENPTTSAHQSNSNDSDLDDDDESLPGSPPDMTELDSDGALEEKNA